VNASYLEELTLIKAQK